MPDLVLAYPYDGHEPDETITIHDEIEAAQLIRDGLARPAPDTAGTDTDATEAPWH